MARAKSGLQIKKSFPVLQARRFFSKTLIGCTPQLRRVFSLSPSFQSEILLVITRTPNFLPPPSPHGLYLER